MESYKKYFLEGFVIFFSVFLSFYVGNLNEEKANFDKKQQYIDDLIGTLTKDIKQIEDLMKEQTI